MLTGRAGHLGRFGCREPCSRAHSAGCPAMMVLSVWLVAGVLDRDGPYVGLDVGLATPPPIIDIKTYDLAGVLHGQVIIMRNYETWTRLTSSAAARP